MAHTHANVSQPHRISQPERVLHITNAWKSASYIVHQLQVRSGQVHMGRISHLHPLVVAEFNRILPFHHLLGEGVVPIIHIQQQ
jgi:hypothetical protein